MSEGREPGKAEAVSRTNGAGRQGARSRKGKTYYRTPQLPKTDVPNNADGTPGVRKGEARQGLKHSAPPKREHYPNGRRQGGRAGKRGARPTDQQFRGLDQQRIETEAIRVGKGKWWTIIASPSFSANHNGNLKILRDEYGITSSMLPAGHYFYTDVSECNKMQRMITASVRNTGHLDYLATAIGARYKVRGRAILMTNEPLYFESERTDAEKVLDTLIPDTIVTTAPQNDKEIGGDAVTNTDVADGKARRRNRKREPKPERRAPPPLKTQYKAYGAQLEGEDKKMVIGRDIDGAIRRQLKAINKYKHDIPEDSLLPQNVKSKDAILCVMRKARQEEDDDVNAALARRVLPKQKVSKKNLIKYGKYAGYTDITYWGLNSIIAHMQENPSARYICGVVDMGLSRMFECYISAETAKKAADDKRIQQAILMGEIGVEVERIKGNPHALNPKAICLTNMPARNAVCDMSPALRSKLSLAEANNCAVGVFRAVYERFSEFPWYKTSAVSWLLAERYGINMSTKFFTDPIEQKARQERDAWELFKPAPAPRGKQWNPTPLQYYSLIQKDYEERDIFPLIMDEDALKIAENMTMFTAADAYLNRAMLSTRTTKYTPYVPGKTSYRTHSIRIRMKTYGNKREVVMFAGIMTPFASAMPAQPANIIMTPELLGALATASEQVMIAQDGGAYHFAVNMTPKDPYPARVLSVTSAEMSDQWNGHITLMTQGVILGGKGTGKSSLEIMSRALGSLYTNSLFHRIRMQTDEVPWTKCGTIREIDWLRNRLGFNDEVSRIYDDLLQRGEEPTYSNLILKVVTDDTYRKKMIEDMRFGNQISTAPMAVDDMNQVLLAGGVEKRTTTVSSNMNQATTIMMRNNHGADIYDKMRDLKIAELFGGQNQQFSIPMEGGKHMAATMAKVLNTAYANMQCANEQGLNFVLYRPLKVGFASPTIRNAFAIVAVGYVDPRNIEDIKRYFVFASAATMLSSRGVIKDMRVEGSYIVAPEAGPPTNLMRGLIKRGVMFMPGCVCYAVPSTIEVDRDTQVTLGRLRMDIRDDMDKSLMKEIEWCDMQAPWDNRWWTEARTWYVTTPGTVEHSLPYEQSLEMLGDEFRYAKDVASRICGTTPVYAPITKYSQFITLLREKLPHGAIVNMFLFTHGSMRDVLMGGEAVEIQDVVYAIETFAAERNTIVKVFSFACRVYADDDRHLGGEPGSKIKETQHVKWYSRVDDGEMDFYQPSKGPVHLTSAIGDMIRLDIEDSPN